MGSDMDICQVDQRIDIRSVRTLRRHNVHAFVPVIEGIAWVGPFDEIGSDQVPGLPERIAAWLPGLAEHQCSLGHPGGFLERLQRGTYLPHICEHVTLELQNRMGFAVSFGRARGTDEPKVHRMVIEYEEAEPA